MEVILLRYRDEMNKCCNNSDSHVVQSWIIVLLALLLGACSRSVPATEPPLTEVAVPLEIDGTTIFVPKAWGNVRDNSPRPWRNGIMAGSGGWGRFEPRVGPLALVGDDGDKRPKDGVYRASSMGQKVDPRGPFSYWDITFEFPLPPVKRNWWGGRVNEQVVHYSYDMLELAYRAPGEKPMPYLTLLKGLKPDDGRDLGNGWRVVAREYSHKTILFRFDAADWRARGGDLPRRLATSLSNGGQSSWYHHLELSPSGWSIDFDTYRLPLSRWRARHITAEALYYWLRTPPPKRNLQQRFVWWEDMRDRPKH